MGRHPDIASASPGLRPKVPKPLRGFVSSVGDSARMRDISGSLAGIWSPCGPITLPVTPSASNTPRPMAMRVRSCRRSDPALYSLPKIGRMTDLSPQNPKQESTYELYTRGVELLERGDYAAAAVPLRKVARGSPASPRSARLSGGRFPLAALRRGRRRVRGRGRALSDQRLRPFLPRPRSRSERRGRRRAPASGDRGQPAARARGLPGLPTAPARLLDGGCGRSSSGSARASVRVDDEVVARSGRGCSSCSASPATTARTRLAGSPQGGFVADLRRC